MKQYLRSRTYRLAGPVPLGAFRAGDHFEDGASGHGLEALSGQTGARSGTEALGRVGQNDSERGCHRGCSCGESWSGVVGGGSGAQKYPYLVTAQTPSRVLVNEAGFTGCGQVGGGVRLLSGIICGRHLRPIVTP
jgi:hypothetical protein